MIYSIASTKVKLSVKTEVFEGPLELLLELVEKRKLLINDISLAAVTDEYMSQVAKMQDCSLSNTAQFVQLAATLLLIKSKSLLPSLELTEEEEESIADLEDRLRLYQIYTAAAKDVLGSFNNDCVLRERQAVPGQVACFVTDKYTNLTTLSEVMEDVINKLPVSVQYPTIKVKPTITLEAMIDRLNSRIEELQCTTLRELVATESAALEPRVVIVGFLAILESVKQGSVLVAQMKRFDDIKVEKTSFNIPKY